MPSSSQSSTSTPSLSSPSDHTSDDNVSSIQSRPISTARIISPSPGQQPQHQKQTKQQPAPRPTVTQSWKWELGSAILLLISVAAIPATIYPHEGQPLPQWPFSISINALLSIYSLGLKASLGFLVTSCIGQLQWSWYSEARPLKDVVLFYEAAHGILGSMQWLWVNRLRQPLTALGALITLVALFIDPFTQQLIQAVDCSEMLSKDTPASVPRTNYFRLGQEAQGPTSLQPTILAGLQTFPNLTDFDCPTGNCTFRNTYSSLSLCSRCSDRSSEVVIDEQCRVESGASHAPDNIRINQPGPCNASYSPYTPEQQYTHSWNLTTSWPPFHLNFYYQTQNMSGTGRTPEMFSILVDLVKYSPEVADRIPFGVTLGYSDSAIFRLDPKFGNPLPDCDDSATNDSWRCRGYGAALCVIQPCVRTYSCSIEAGQVKETIVEESNLDQTWGVSDAVSVYNGDYAYPTSLLGLLDLQCITDADRGNLIMNGYDVVTAGRWLSYNVTFDIYTSPANASSPFPESLLANGCLYIIESDFFHYLREKVLSPDLVGSVTRSPYYYWKIEGVQFTYEGKEHILHLYNSGNVSMASISDMFANLAQLLTLWVRSNGEARYSQRAEGDVLHYAVCVRVTWAWVALPATLAGLALLMFALTVATTARRAVPTWKLFPLAVLLCGPAGDSWVDQDLLAADTSKVGKTSARDDGSVDDMSRLAGRVFVQLSEQDGKYQLCQVEVQSTNVQH